MGHAQWLKEDPDNNEPCSNRINVVPFDCVAFDVIGPLSTTVNGKIHRSIKIIYYHIFLSRETDRNHLFVSKPY